MHFLETIESNEENDMPFVEIYREIPTLIGEEIRGHIGGLSVLIWSEIWPKWARKAIKIFSLCYRISVLNKMKRFN